MRSLTSAISVAVAQAVKDAMAAHQASFPNMATPTPSAAVEQIVQNDVCTVAICNNHRTLLYLSRFVINPSHFVIPVAICNKPCRTL